MSRPEQALQAMIVQGLETCLPHGWLVNHVANNPRSKVAGGIAKRMGAKAGFPDRMVLGRLPDGGGVDRGVIHFLEVKPPKVTVPAYQRDMHDRLTDLGFKVAVVRSWGDVCAFARLWDWPWRGRS